MTTKQDKLNAVFLSALMVLSVMVGSIALAGSAAAVTTVTVTDGAPAQQDGVVNVTADVGTAGNSITFDITDSAGTASSSVTVTDGGSADNDGANDSSVSATLDLSSMFNEAPAEGTATINAADSGGTSATTSLEIEDGSAPSIASAIEYTANSGSTDGDIEVAFGENVQAITSGNFSVSVNGEEKTGEFSLGNDVGTNGRLVLTSTLELQPSDNVEVTVDGQDNTGEVFSDTATVRTTSTTFTQTQLGDTTQDSAYEGSRVAYVAGSQGAKVNIEKKVDSSNWEYVFGGSTSKNSKVFVFDTEGKEAGLDYRFKSDGGSFALNPFGMSIDSPSTVTNAQAFNYVVSASAGDKDVEVEFIKEGDNSGEIMPRTLDGDGESEFSITPSETGNYTIEVTDTGTGVTVTSDTITVEKQGEETVAFSSSNANERGDVVEIPVSLQNTKNAAVQLGADGAAYRVHLNVTDGNNDGKVTLLLNSYNVTEDNDYGVSVAHTDDDYEIDTDTDTNSDVKKPLDAGTYDLTAGIDNTGAGASALGVFSVRERSTTGATTYIAPSNPSITDSVNVDDLTQTKKVAFQDQVIVKVDASGIYGQLNDTQSLSDDSGNLTLKLSQVDPGKNSDGVDVKEEDISLIQDSQNNTLYLVIDTNSLPTEDGSDGTVEAGQKYNVTFTVADDRLTNEDQSVSTEFSIQQRTASINTNADDVVELPASSEATLSGTSTLAPGSTIRVQVRSDNNEFIDTVQTTVDENGEWTATYDLSGASTETTFSAVVRNLMTTPLDGEVVDSVSTTTEPGTTETPPSTTKQPTTSQSTTEPPQTSESTDTPEDPGTESDGGVPGFGLSAALIALIGAALIALRRD